MANFPANMGFKRTKHHKGGCQSWLAGCCCHMLFCPLPWNPNDQHYQHSDDGLKHVKTTKQIYRALETPVFCMAKPQIPADIMRSGWDTIDVCNPNMWKSMRDHCKYQPHISVEVQMKPQGCRPVMTIRKWQKRSMVGRENPYEKKTRCWNSWDFPARTAGF